MAVLERFLQNQKIRLIFLRGVNGQEDIEVRPPIGKSWLIMDGWGYHGDATNRACSWRYRDGTQAFGKTERTTADAEHNDLSIDANLTAPSIMGHLIIDYNNWMEFHVTSLGAYKATVQLVVLEFGPDL